MMWFKWLKNLCRKPEAGKPEGGKSETGKRVAFIITDPEYFNLLQQRGNHPDATDLLNTAITVYKWALDATEEGRPVVSLNVSDDSYRELCIPGLDQLKTWTDEDDD